MLRCLFCFSRCKTTRFRIINQINNFYLCIDKIDIMTLQQLEYVVALDTCRHFVTAAEKCFVTQPTLTMQIKKLEEEMGIKIFNRCHKPLRPTREGEKIIRHAYKVLAEVNQIKELVRNKKETMSGIFNVGIIPSLAPYLLPLFLPGFIKKYPLIQLKIHELQTHQIVEGLREDRLDMGILVSPLEERGIHEHFLFHEEFMVYLPPGHPLQKEEYVTAQMLNPTQMLVLTEGHCFRNQILNICGEAASGNPLNFHYESGSIETLKRMVDTGMGYTLIPALSVNDAQMGAQLKRFALPKPVRDVSLACGYGFSGYRLLEELGNCIKEAIPESMKSVSGKTISIH